MNESTHKKILFLRHLSLNLYEYLLNNGFDFSEASLLTRPISKFLEKTTDSLSPDENLKISLEELQNSMKEKFGMEFDLHIIRGNKENK